MNKWKGQRLKVMIREQIQVYVRKLNTLLSRTEIKFVKVSFVRIKIKQTLNLVALCFPFNFY